MTAYQNKHNQEWLTIPPSLVYELATGGYRWDENAARFRSKDTGRFVSQNAIQKDIERFDSTDVNDELQGITDRMIDGRITLSQWQTRSAVVLKDAWGVNVRVGRGGADQMTQTDFGRYGGRLAFEYDRLNRFAVEIEIGNLSPEQIKVRIGLYANATRVGYWDGVTAAQAASENVFEQRFLQPGESCEDCMGYAAAGKVPIGTLPEPGEASVCQRNCNCIKRFFKE